MSTETKRPAPYDAATRETAGAPREGTRPAAGDTARRAVATQPYFRSLDRQQLLLNHVALWRGTPWRHAGAHPHRMKCGVHADCLFWVAMFQEMGALPPGKLIPDYRKMEAAKDDRRQLRECIEATGRAQLVWERKQAAPHDAVHREDSPRAATGETTGENAAVNARGYSLRIGDVLLFANGMSGVHCGLVVRTVPCHFFHIGPNGAIETPFGQDQWVKGLAAVYRLMEPVAEGDDLGPRSPSAATAETTGPKLTPRLQGETI
jgi:hypothetical protein